MISEGTPCVPFIQFGYDNDSGVWIKSPGVLGYSIDGIEVSINEFLEYCLVTGRLGNLALVVNRLSNVTLGGEVAKSIEHRRDETCPDCSGYGEVNVAGGYVVVGGNSMPCPQCGDWPATIDLRESRKSIRYLRDRLRHCSDSVEKLEKANATLRSLLGSHTLTL